MPNRKIRPISTLSACLQLILVGALFALAILWLGGCAEDETPIPQETPEEDLEAPVSAASYALTADDEDADLAPPKEAASLQAGGGATPAASGYDRGRVLAYVERYAKSPNAGFAYCGDWTFSEGRFRKTPADCTNFASQALWQGGLPLAYGASEHEGWWYRDGCTTRGSSRSWRQVNALLYWLTIGSRRGELKRDARELEIGDVIFYKLRREEDGWRCVPDATFNHTAIVSGKDGNGQPLVSYHSNDALHVPWAAKNGSQAALGEACSVAFVHIR